MTREQATEEIKRFMDDYEGEESDILEALDFALANMGTLQEIMDTVKGVMEERKSIYADWLIMWLR